jgi:hypothetical protein
MSNGQSLHRHRNATTNRGASLGAMPTTVINAAGTFNLKLGACGYIQQITSQSVGTGFAVRVLDGPDPAGNLKTLLFSSAVAIPAAGGNMLANPIFFGQGLQIISSGTPGEFEVQWT